jgi:hypothetical protein
MHTLWTAEEANNSEAKEALERTIKSSTTVLNRLRAIIEEKERAIYNKLISSSSYKDSDWSHLSAHTCGRLFELNELKQLTNTE